MSLLLKVKTLLNQLILKFSVGNNRLGRLGYNSSLPRDVSIAGPNNVYIADNVLLGKQTTLHAVNAKITIKQGVVAAKGLKISTGNHERQIGHFVSTIKEKDKHHDIGLDKDVVIEEDVWLGFNVIVLSGVTIGRGCTIAAGSVVTKSTCPYSIWGGVPARFIKFYWTIDEIIEHEKILYPEEERYDQKTLETIFENNSIK